MRAEARTELAKTFPKAASTAGDLGEVAEPVFVQERRLQRLILPAVQRAKQVEDLAHGHMYAKHFLRA